MHMRVLSAARRHLWCWVIFLIFMGLGSRAIAVNAGARFVATCNSDFCYSPPLRKPNPEVQNQQYAKASLHAVFADEEKKYPGLAAFLDNTANAAYQRALTDMRSLRAGKATANATDLQAQMMTKKSVYLKDAGIQDWINTYRQATVTAFSPREGAPGDKVTITGTNLNDTNEVYIATAKAGFTVVNDTTIEVTIPVYAYQLLPIRIVTRYGEVKSAQPLTILNGACTDEKIQQAFWELLQKRARGTGTSGQCDPKLYGPYKTYEELVKLIQQKFGFVKREPPQVTDIFFDHGPPGSKVRIDGKNFYQLQSVLFGNVRAAAVQRDSEWLLFATVPEGGSGTITVATLSGVARSAKPFELVAAPVMDYFTPSEIVVGETIRIIGKNFGSDPFVLVNNNRVYGLITKTPTEIQLKLTDPVKDAAVVVRTTGGDTKYFGKLTVWSGNCRDPWIIRAFQELFERKPYGQGDEGQCEPAKYRGGKWVSYNDLKFGVRQRYGYKQKAAPTITRIDPSPAIAGEWATIYGTGFEEVQSVVFGNNVADEVQVKSPTELRAKIHFGSSRDGQVYVTTLYGYGSFANVLAYPPSISGVDPTTALPGVDVVLRGVNFTDVEKVYFGGVEVTSKNRSANQMMVTVPKGIKGNVEIKVTSKKGNSSWSPFGIVSARLITPNGLLKNLRFELIGPNGNIIGSAPLIGNAGAGLSDAQVTALIGNSGVSLIGNAGAGLSIQDMSSLIGNAGAGLIGNTAAGLAGNAGSSLIGNAGAGLIGNAGAGLIVNAGTGLVDGSIQSLTGRNLSDILNLNNASPLANVTPLKVGTDLTQVSPLTGNAPLANVTPLTDTTPFAGNSGSGLVAVTGAALAARSILSLSAHAATPSRESEIRPADNTMTGVVPPVTPSVEPPTRFVAPTTTPPAKPPSEPVKKKVAVPPVSVPAPTPAPKPTQEPNPTPTPIVPAPQPSPTPQPTPEPVSPAVPQPCSPYVPKYQQPNCIEQVEEQKRSPYDGLPCPSDSVPNYAKIGCIAQ